MLYVDANTSRMLYPRTGNMEDMDLPHPRWSLSQSKHGMKGSNINQQYETTTPNEFIVFKHLSMKSSLNMYYLEYYEIKIILVALM